jgi:hypothetical protein
MPGSDIAELQLLGNLLALPNTIAARNAQQQQNHAQLQAMAGAVPPGQAPLMSPEQVNTFAPPGGGSFPGMGVPVLGSMLKGIGSVGQMMQLVSGGGGQPAPRIPREVYQMLDQARKSRGYETVGGDIESGADPKTLGSDVARAGFIPSALKVIGGGKAGGGGSEFQQWRTENPGKSVADWETFKAGLKHHGGEGGGGAPDRLGQARWLSPGTREALVAAGKDPRTATPADITGAQAGVAKGKRLAKGSPQLAQRLGNIRTTLGIVDQVDQSIDKVFSHSPAAVMSRGQQAGAYIASLRGDKDATLLQQLPSFRATVARAFGDVGRLSQQEETNVQRAMPDLAADTAERAKAKISNIRMILTEMQRRLQEEGEDSAAAYVKDFARRAAAGIEEAPTPAAPDAGGAGGEAPSAAEGTTPGGNTFKVIEP